METNYKNSIRPLGLTWFGQNNAFEAQEKYLLCAQQKEESLQDREESEGRGERRYDESEGGLQGLGFATMLPFPSHPISCPLRSSLESAAFLPSGPQPEGLL